MSRYAGQTVWIKCFGAWYPGIINRLQKTDCEVSYLYVDRVRGQTIQKVGFRKPEDLRDRDPAGRGKDKPQ